MTIRHALAAGSAIVALAATTPALAAQEMSYEQNSYEFAQPLPEGETQPVFTSDPVVQQVPTTMSYRSMPVVQDLPSAPEPTAYHEAPRPEIEYGYAEPQVYDPHSEAASYPVDYETPFPEPQYPTSQYPGTQYPSAPYPTTQHYPAAHHSVPHAARGHYDNAAYAGPPLPPQASYDRDSWLDNCESELRRRKNAGAVGGGLLGAIAGGVIGNRVADGERLGGTLLGAGIGGIAGAAIGSAIGSAVRGNPYLRECKAWLENYESGNYGGSGQQAYGYGYPQPAYGYAQPGYGYSHAYAQQAYGYTYVPGFAYVTTTYPIQQPVVREYVTEEWVDVPVEHHVEYETEVRHVPAPPPAPRYIKGKTRYIKGH